MTLLQTMVKGFQASVTLDNIYLSMDETTSGGPRTGTGAGNVSFVNGANASYEKIYLSQIWVNATVNKLSRGIGRIPLKVYVAGDEDGERQRVREGPLADLLRRPYEGCTPFQFKSAVIGNIGIYGNCVAVKIQEKGQPPTELIPSSFAYWRLIPGTDRAVDWYIYSDERGNRIPFRPEEVVHWRWWGPGRDLVGPSPIEPLRRTLIVEDAAQRTQIASYEHGARPVGAWSIQEKLTDEQVATTRKQVEDTYGGVDNAYRVAIMMGGAKWEPMQHSMVDSEIINTRRLTREEVAASYDMPPPVIQILDRATFSNITEQHLMLYMDTMGPPLCMFEETLQVQLIDPEPTMQGQYVEFDLNEVLKGDITKRYDAYQKAQWWMTADEVRERENLPPKSADDARAAKINMPLSSSSLVESVTAVGGLVRAGYDPEDALEVAGLPPIKHTGFIPVTVQPDDDGQAAATIDKPPFTLLAEVRCPACSKKLTGAFQGKTEMWCDRCKTPVPVDSSTPVG